MKLGAFVVLLWAANGVFCVCQANLPECSDVGGSIRAGTSGCIMYDDLVFSMRCDFVWTDVFNKHDCIILGQHEIFEGNGYTIDLTDDITDWNGLFKIQPDVSSLQNAPTIKNLHIIRGGTSAGGGFFVQAQQKHFVVFQCSSSGTINGAVEPHALGGGGICGHACSGEILIRKCHSSGEIGPHSGGIAGRRLGINGGVVTIDQCHSTGVILGTTSGGVCGSVAGWEDGHVSISHCYSTGKISGTYSGGLCASPGSKGFVSIIQSYSTGKIDGNESGGLTGAWTGQIEGHVDIRNSYSHGTIAGKEAGGICGKNTGLDQGTVTIENVYARGLLSGSGAGMLIGVVATNAKKVDIRMSVYRGAPMIGLDSEDRATEEHNSDDLSSIVGKVYCSDSGNTNCWDGDTIWKAEFEALPILRTPFPSPSVTPTSSPTSSLSTTPTKTPSPSCSVTGSRSPSLTMSPSSSLSHTPSPSVSGTSSATETHSGTASADATSTSSSSPTSSHSSSASRSRTSAPTASRSASWSPSPSASLTGTATLSRTSTATLTSSSHSSSAHPSPTTTLTCSVARSSKSESPTISTSSSWSHTSPSPPVAATITPSVTQSSSDSPGAGSGRTPFSTRDTMLAPKFLGSLVVVTFACFFCTLYIIYKRKRNQTIKDGCSSLLEQSIAQQGSSTELKTVKALNLSSVKTEEMAVNPLRYWEHLRASHNAKPNVEIIDVKTSEGTYGVSSVRVISVRTPNFGQASTGTRTKLSLARIEDLDTSEMRVVDRSILKLRQWKAKLLAEPPPLVEVEEENKAEHEMAPVHTKSIIRRLEFAKRQGSDRNIINSEIKEYSLSKRKYFGKTQRRKKEFRTLPLSMDDS